ncbi:hypothetical protein VNI00_000783 [Paramarasmius palmivorus]|uniref:Uncharacterized protein n=1 Tax=Paramarasmius palmivorus TaxID=297713 RepID=A0AAW0EBW6_9AGAR
MGKVNPNEKEEGNPGRLRRLGYGAAFFLVFAIAAAALGLDAQQLHKYGNTNQNYASLEYKNALGLCLFSCIFTFLWLIAHWQVNMGLSIFFTLVGAVFWGTCAGIFYHSTPFRAFTCDNPVDTFPTKWQPYVGECTRVVSLQGLCWAEWALLCLMLVMSIIHKIEIRPRPEASYYGP